MAQGCRHFRPGRRTDLDRGLRTPSLASRFSLSRSMSAFRSSLEMAVLSIGRVSLLAFASPALGATLTRDDIITRILARFRCSEGEP